MRLTAAILFAALLCAGFAIAAEPALAASGRVSVDGAELEYRVTGSGEPVLFIHGSLFADAFAPLLHEPALKGYRLITYHREGYAGSTHAPGSLSIARQATDALAVLDALDVKKAYVVGHGYGGLIALQLALDAPARIQSLALMEASIRPVLGGSADAKASRAMKAYEAGKRREALDLFLVLANGGDYRAAIVKALPPGAMDLAAKDLDRLVQDENPSRQAWVFGAAEAAQLPMPVLCLAGERTIPAYFRGHRDLLQWLPRSRGAVVAGAPHAMQMVNPNGVAQALADFFGENPISAH